MSFSNIFSKLATIAPDNLSWVGYCFSLILQGASSLLVFIATAFYGVCKWFLAFVDFMQYFIQKLIGLDYWLTPGSKSIQGATDNDLLFSFLYNETVQDVFRALVGLFIVLLIVFTIFAIIKQEWTFATGGDGKSDNSKTKIISSSMKAIALVVITPLVLVIGIVSSNAILASIVQALNIDMSTSFGNTIFSVSSVGANKYRIYTEEKDRSPVSTTITFYVDTGSIGKDDDRVILFGDVAVNGVDDGYSKTYSNYDDYLTEIGSAEKYTVDSMFPIVNPMNNKEFYGYCISLNIDGADTYYMVKVDVDNTTSYDNIRKIDGMYYYLTRILKADLMVNGNTGKSELYDVLKDEMKEGSSHPGFISKLNIHNTNSDELMEACYNTWDYASIYKKTFPFETTTKSVTINDPNVFTNSYALTGITSAKIMYNAYDHYKYFDGGQFGVVQMNAEYGVMTDVIDFICEKGARLYILDATSPLINWNYEGYSVDTKWVATTDGNVGQTIQLNDQNKYLPFVVDYSETALDHESGKTLYFAEEGVNSELDGAKFIMCWKVAGAGGGYIPLINRKTFIDPETQQSYYFNSEYLSNEYKGVVLAKGNFDANMSVADPTTGEPTYLKVGASLDDGNNAIEYENNPYFYDISQKGVLAESLNLATTNQSMILSDVNFMSSEFQNITIKFDDIDQSLFRFYNTSTDQYVDPSNDMINALKLRVSEKTNGIYSNLINATYANVNDGINYLFNVNGSLMTVSIVDSNDKTLTIRAINQDGTINNTKIVPESISASAASEFDTVKHTYNVKLDYTFASNTNVSTSITIDPLELTLGSASNGNYLFTTKDKYLIQLGDINQNYALSFYANRSSIFSFENGNKLNVAEGNGTYELNMYDVLLYDFYTGYVDNSGVYTYDPSDSSIKPVIDPIETYTFGVFENNFNWENNSTEYNVYNGSAYVAKLIKSIGMQFNIDNIAGTNNENSKTIAIEVNGIRYYNVKTQNVFADSDKMEEAYNIIHNSMFVGAYRDRIDTVTVFDISANIFTGSRMPKLALGQPTMKKECLLTESNISGIFSLTDGIAFDYFFEDKITLMQFYNPWEIAYWLILVSAALIIKTLGTALWGIIKRFYEITLYYLAMPVAASTMPLDGGDKFKKVQTSLVQNVLGTYGVILGINVFFILLAPIKSMSSIFTQAEMDSSSSYFLRHFPFSAKVLNNYVYILFLLVAFTMIDALPKVISGLVGAGDKDVKAQGGNTKGEVGNALKSAGDMISGKTLMDAGKTAINTVSNLPMIQPLKAGAGWVKNRIQNARSSYDGGATQAQDDIDGGGGGETTNTSNRADGENEAPNDSNTTNGGDGGNGSGGNDANIDEEAVREIVQDELSRHQISEDGSDSNDSDDSNDGGDAAQEDLEAAAEREFNNEAMNSMSEQQKADTRAGIAKDMAANGTNAEITNDIAANIINANTNQNGEVQLDPDMIRQIIREIMGDQAAGMSDDEIDQKYKLDLGKTLDGKMYGSITSKDANGNDVEQELDANQLGQMNKAIVENSSDANVAAAVGGLSDSQKQHIDNSYNSTGGTISFGTDSNGKVNLENASVDALKVVDKFKDDDNIQNEVILQYLNNHADSKSAFLRESGLNENATDEDMLKSIAVLKNSGNSNMAALINEKIQQNALGKDTGNEFAQVIARKYQSGEIKVTAWDLASNAEKEAQRAKTKEAHGMLTDEEKEIKEELTQQAVENYANSNTKEYNSKMLEAFFNSSDIENKDEMITKLLLASQGLDDKSATNKQYRDALKDIRSIFGGQEAVNDLAKQGYSEDDILAAYTKMRLYTKDVKGMAFDNDTKFTLMQTYLEHRDENKDVEYLPTSPEEQAKMVNMLLNGNDNNLPMVTDEEKTKLNKKVADEIGIDVSYDKVKQESDKRAETERLYESQKNLITVDMLNQNKNSANYQALLDQIKQMIKEEGGNPDTITEITAENLQKLINNDDNVGIDPIELENLKKEIIRSKVDANQDGFTKTTNESGLSGKDKLDFEYKKAIIEEQMNGANGNEVIDNLINNSNFIGKKELLQKYTENGVFDTKKALAENPELKDTLLNIGATDVTKALSQDTLIEKQKEAIKADPALMKQMKDAGLNVDSAADIANLSENAAFAGRINDKINAMIDPSKMVSKEDKENFFNAKESSSDIVGAGTAIKNGAINIKNTFNSWVDNNATDKNAGFMKKVGSAVANATWVKGKSKIQDLYNENGQDIGQTMGAVVKTPFVKLAQSGAAEALVYKITKRPPDQSKKYDQWNELLDKDIEAVKAGKGAYKDLSREERKAKIEELSSKKVDTALPKDFYSWGDDKKAEYYNEQDSLKKEILETNFSKINKEHAKANKVKDKNVILKFADNLGYTAGNIPVLRAVTSNFASDELKQKHEQDLALAAANIDRYKSTEPMRIKSKDFGAGFETFAKSYNISQNAIDKIEKDINKKGLTGKDAETAREEAFAKELNKQYRVASDKVARDSKVNKDVFLKEKGINAGSVRYKDGTKKYTQVQSRLNLHIPGVTAGVNAIITAKRKHDIDKYDAEYEKNKGLVDDKTRKKYENSYYGKRSQEAAVRSQNEAINQQKLHDEIIAFNKNYKGKKEDYSKEFIAKFGKQGEDLYKKYNKLYNVGTAGSKVLSQNLNLEKSPVIVQQRELLKQLEHEMKKNYNRQKYASAYIPASELAKAKYAIESFTNKKNHASVAHDKQMAGQFNEAYKEFMANKGNTGFNVNNMLDKMSPVIREEFNKKFNEFKRGIKGFDNMSPDKQKDYFQKFLENGMQKYNRRVANNTFTPDNRVANMGGTAVGSSSTSHLRVSPQIKRSLDATQSGVYENLIKQCKSAMRNYNLEENNLKNLRRRLNEVQSGIQNNATKKAAQQLKDAIRNSEIKLNNLDKVKLSSEARLNAFKQAIAASNIKQAVRQNAQRGNSTGPISYKRPDGSPREVKPGTIDQRQIEMLQRRMRGEVTAQLDNMTKTMLKQESQKLVEYINRVAKNVSNDANKNYKNLVEIQNQIKKQLQAGIDQTKKTSKKDKMDLEMQNQKLDKLIKRMVEEFRKMDIDIR